MELPTQNSRTLIKGPTNNQSRQIAERDQDIAEILGYCKEVPEQQVRRMTTLK
jgi:hypothetical protein